MLKKHIMQKVYRGPGSVECVREIVQELRWKKIAIVCGLSSQKHTIPRVLYYINGNAKYIILQTTSFWDDVTEKTTQLRDNFGPIDGFIAVGGGKIIDATKTLSVLTQQPHGAYQPAILEFVIEKPALPILAIPTTVGSGSEATHSSAVYHGGEKYALSHISLLPHHVILDPLLVKHLHKNIIATTGMSTIVRSIESLWSKERTEESETYAKNALRIVIASLQKTHDTRATYLLQKLMEAAYDSGKAIAISRTTLSSALAHTLMLRHRISFGYASALGLLVMLAFNTSQYHNTSDSTRALEKIAEIFFQKNPTNITGHIEYMMRGMSLVTRFSMLGLTKNDITRCAQTGFAAERAALNPYPIIQKQFVEAALSRL